MKIMKKLTGFTLLELMIALVIVAILMSIAIPSYQQWTRKSRRSEGMSALMQMQLAQERWRANNTSYGTLAQAYNGVSTTDNGYYTLAVTANSATGYTMTATGNGDQANDTESGTACATLTITVAGANTSKTPAACWD